MWDNNNNNVNPVPPMYTQPSFEPVVTNPVPQKSKKPLILIILIVAVVLVLGVSTVILLVNKKSKPVTEETSQDVEEAGPIYITEELVDALDQVYPPIVITDIEVALNNYFSTVYSRGTELSLGSSSLNSNDDYEWRLKTTDSKSHTMVVTWRVDEVKIVIGDEFEQEFTNPPHYDD